MGGVQHLEQPNVEWPVFRNFEISSLKKSYSIFYLTLREYTSAP